MKVGIVGHGCVGKATALLGETPSIEVVCYDLEPEFCLPVGCSLEDVAGCEIVFICVPTPMAMNGACLLDEVTEVVSRLRDARSQAHLVIRSTVPPGTSRKLGCHTMPDALGEATAETDFRATSRWMVGVNDHLPSAHEYKDLFTDLVKVAKGAGVVESDVVAFVTPEEAEVVNYARNAYLATKVGVSNEIATYCERMGIRYDTVREHVGADARIGDSHLQVPGPDGKFGFGGPNLMKDLMAFCHAMDAVGTSSFILRPVMGRNARRDRPDEVWYSPPKVKVLTKEVVSGMTVGQLRTACQARHITVEKGVEREEIEKRLLQAPSTGESRALPVRPQQTGLPQPPGQTIPQPPVPQTQRNGLPQSFQSRPNPYAPGRTAGGQTVGFNGGVQQGFR